MFQIQNNQGRTFTVKLGLDRTVEFYSDNGALLRTYGIDTLTGRDGFNSDIRNGHALALSAGNGALTLDPVAAAQAVDWAASQLY
jgi:predicted chitinase